MKLTVAWIGKTKELTIQQLTEKYLERIGHYAQAETVVLKDEAHLLAQYSRGKHYLVALDSRGEQLTSDAFAEFVSEKRDRAIPILFALGPASGFSGELLQSADFTISLGKMTLQHELARIVLLEQIYRALTILKGHPYHSGH